MSSQTDKPRLVVVAPPRNSRYARRVAQPVSDLGAPQREHKPESDDESDDQAAAQ